MKNKIIEDKYLKIKEYIESLMEDGICIAFSGGVDSSLILKIVSQISKKQKGQVYAVTFETKLHPVSDVSISKKVAEEMGVKHEIIKINELQNKEILNNPIDRCYLCKKMLFTNLLQFAKEKGLKYVLDGTNADDLKTYRPGVKALKELEIISPLAKFNISKEEVRTIAEYLNISVANRPSTPCMATRLPYNIKIEFELLKRIEKGEDYLRSLGFDVVRLRVHDDIARIEIEKKDFKKLLDNSEDISKYLKNLGFTYITLDIEGFRSGSMDINIR